LAWRARVVVLGGEPTTHETGRDQKQVSSHGEVETLPAKRELLAPRKAEAEEDQPTAGLAL
jgi:hypothetical protein